LPVYFSVYMLIICSSFDTFNILSSQQTPLKILKTKKVEISLMISTYEKSDSFVFYSEKYSLNSWMTYDCILSFAIFVLNLVSLNLFLQIHLCLYIFSWISSYTLIFTGIPSTKVAICKLYWLCSWEFLTFKVQIVFNVFGLHMPLNFIYGASLSLNQNLKGSTIKVFTLD
jgi:hypothetical protein